MPCPIADDARSVPTRCDFIGDFVTPAYAPPPAILVLRQNEAEARTYRGGERDKTTGFGSISSAIAPGAGDPPRDGPSCGTAFSVLYLYPLYFGKSHR